MPEEVAAAQEAVTEPAAAVVTETVKETTTTVKKKGSFFSDKVHWSNVDSRLESKEKDGKMKRKVKGKVGWMILKFK